MKKKVVAVLLMVSMVAALAIGCGSKKEGGSEKNEGTTEKTKSHTSDFRRETAR